jgi:alpha-L-fucosidase
MKNIKARPREELCHFNIPQWFKDVKFGIYTHWGVYAVGVCGLNVSWYPYNMYREGTEQYKHHCKNFRHSSKAGYKDLILLFNGTKGWDVSDPAYEGLYGKIHNTEWDSKTAYEPGFMYDQYLPSVKAQEFWLNKIVEFIVKYGPNYTWLENELEFIGDYYKRAAFTYYYDYTASHNKEVMVSYKNHNLPVGAGLYNMECAHFQDLTYFDWICDTTIDNHEAWGYMDNAFYVMCMGEMGIRW